MVRHPRNAQRLVGDSCRGLDGPSRRPASMVIGRPAAARGWLYV